MLSYVALYRGEDLNSAKLIAVTADPQLVGEVAAGILKTRPEKPNDAAVSAVEGGQRRALRIVRKEAKQAIHDDAVNG